MKGKKKKNKKERNGDREFGEHFRKLIDEKYDSQREFSLVVECSEEYVSRVINAAISPTHNMLKEFAQALDITVQELVDINKTSDKSSKNK